QEYALTKQDGSKIRGAATHRFLDELEGHDFPLVGVRDTRSRAMNAVLEAELEQLRKESLAHGACAVLPDAGRPHHVLTTFCFNLFSKQQRLPGRRARGASGAALGPVAIALVVLEALSAALSLSSSCASHSHGVAGQLADKS